MANLESLCYELTLWHYPWKTLAFLAKSLSR